MAAVTAPAAPKVNLGAARQARIHAAAAQGFAASGGPNAAQQARIQHAAALGFGASVNPTLTPQQVKYITAGMAKPQAPAKAAAPIAQAPAQQPAQQNPLDATYFSNAAQNLFNVNNKVTGLQQQSAASSNALQTALGNLAYQQPRDQLKLMQAANARGGLYSTPYDQQQGDLVHNYATRQTAAIAADAARQQAVQQQIASLQSGIPLYNEQQALASAIRMSAQAAKNPALGQPAVPTTAQPKAPKAGGHYVWNNGAWQLIHAVAPGRWAPGPVKAKGKK